MFGSNTSGGLFGAKPASTGGFGAPASNTSGGLFGNNNANSAAPAANSGGLFGNNNNASNASGGLFGSNNNNNNTTGNPSGGMFGNRPASASFGLSSTTSGGLFGSKPSAAPGTTGGLFGGNNNANTGTTGGLFGGNNATNNNSGGLLGNNAAKPGFGATNNTNATSSGGLFGSKPAATGGLFGTNNTNTSSSGGLFGSNNNTATTGGGLFGNNNTTNNTATSGGLFGSKPASGGLFGSNNQTNNTNTSGGLFGGNNNNSTGGGLFGSKPASSGLFGGNSSNSGLFGNNNQAQNQMNNPNSVFSPNSQIQLNAMTRVGDLPEPIKRELQEFDKYINQQHLIATNLQNNLKAHDELIKSLPKDINYIYIKSKSTKQALKFDSNHLNNLKELNNELTDDINKMLQLILQLSVPGTKLSSSFQLNEFFVKKIKEYQSIINNYEELIQEISLILQNLETSSNSGFGNFLNVFETIKVQFNLFMELCENLAQTHNQLTKYNV